MIEGIQVDDDGLESNMVDRLEARVLACCTALVAFEETRERLRALG